MSSPTVVPNCSTCTTAQLCSTVVNIIGRLNAIDGQGLQYPSQAAIAKLQADVQSLQNDIDALTLSFESSLNAFKTTLNYYTGILNGLVNLPSGTNQFQP